jgi:sugar lactone lactonase YvrE
MAIAVASDGTIYTADLELHRIWKMPAEGSEMPTEFAVINSPRGLTLDPEGNLWVLSTSSKDGQIQKVTPDGKVEPFIKDHPFNLPHNVVRMDDGTFFVTDNYEHAVWKVAADGKPEKFVSGPPLDRPVGLCRSGENLLVADPHIRTIFSLAPDKTLTALVSSPVDPVPDAAAPAK